MSQVLDQNPNEFNWENRDSINLKKNQSVMNSPELQQQDDQDNDDQIGNGLKDDQDGDKEDIVGDNLQQVIEDASKQEEEGDVPGEIDPNDPDFKNQANKNQNLRRRLTVEEKKDFQ